MYSIQNGMEKIENYYKEIWKIFQPQNWNKILHNNYDNIFDITKYIKGYLFFYIIRIFFFFNHHCLSHLLICSSLYYLIYYNESNFNEINITFLFDNTKIILCLLISYLFYVSERIYFTYYNSSKSIKNIIIIVNGVIAIGLLMIILYIMALIKYEFYYYNKALFYWAEFGGALVIVGNSFYIGKLNIDFIFYSIEKEYFIYRNPKYKKFIRVAQYTPYELSKYAQ